MAALDRNRVYLFVRYGEVDVLCNLKAAALVGRFDDLFRDIVDELLAQPIAGLEIDLSEGRAFAAAGGRIEDDRTTDERKFQITLPGRAGGHGVLQRNRIGTDSN